MFKRNSLVFLLILVSLVAVTLVVVGREDAGRSLGKFTGSNVIGDVKYLQVNNLSIPFGNNGIISDVGDGIAGPLHGSYAEFPAGSDIHFIFSSGFFVSGMIGGELWASGVASASRVQDYIEGSFGTDRGDANNKIYVVSSQDAAGSDAYADWANAVAAGADFVDTDDNGSYDPAVDKPDLLGDQMLWFTLNDGVAVGNRAWPGAKIVGMEVQVTAWAFARGGALGNIAFIRFRLVNKGTDTIEDMYFSSWHDPDLGEYTDDLIGCDVELSAGFTYNEGSDGAYGDAPPVFLVDFFQGPLVASPGDTAQLVRGPNLGVETVLDHRVLGMSSFTQYKQGDPSLGDPDTQEEARFYMTGLTQQGEVFEPTERGTGGSASDDPNFWYSGDPESQTGWLQSGGDDQRMLLNTGAFRMEPGDVQDIVTGFVVGQGDGPLNSVTVAKEVDILAQTIYDQNFDIAGPPPAVQLRGRVTKDEGGDFVVDILWDAAEAVNDRQLKAGADQQFEGFIVKQFRSKSTSDEVDGIQNSKVIGRFDLNNDLGDLYADVDGQGRVLLFSAEDNLEASAFDNDAGAHVNVRLTRDAFTGEAFKLGTVYYFGVIGYGVDRNGIVKNENTVIDNDWVATVPSQILQNAFTDGLNFMDLTPGFTENAFVSLGNSTTHDSGPSDGSVTWDIVDPTEVTGDNYMVSFFVDTTDGATKWRLTNTTTNAVVLDAQPNQAGGFSYPVVDGIMVKVVGPAFDFKDFQVTANASGVLASPVGAAADYQGFPGLGRTDIGNQQTNGSMWFVEVNDNTNGSYGRFFARTTQYTGGLGESDQGISHLIPNDYEIRFTAAGGKAFFNWSTNAVVQNVPFELWNVGPTSDPSDDYRLFCWVLDYDDDDAYNLVRDGADHAASGGTNDPWLDALYWVEPLDTTPGQAGYDALVAAHEADPAGASDETLWAFKFPGAPWNSVPGFMRMSLVSWNGGETTDPTYPANVAAPLPEEGTIFKIVTNKANGVNDTFAFSTASDPALSGLNAQKSNFASVNVFPNPYFANNSLEGPTFEEDQFVTFSHMPSQAKVRIYTISGKLVRTIVKSDDSPFMRWDLLNESGLKVASGVYIAHIEAGELGEQKVVKIAVISKVSRVQRF